MYPAALSRQHVCYRHDAKAVRTHINALFVILLDVFAQSTAESDTVKAKHGVFDDQIAIIALDILLGLLSRTGIKPNCPTTMHFRIFRRAFACKICILLRKITPKSIKNAFAGGCAQF